jgi:hypothetical protein
MHVQLLQEEAGYIKPMIFSWRNVWYLLVGGCIEVEGCEKSGVRFEILASMKFRCRQSVDWRSYVTQLFTN